MDVRGTSHLACYIGENSVEEIALLAGTVSQPLAWK